MIKGLLELRESIEELNLLSAVVYISFGMWSSLEDIRFVLEMPCSLTVNLQAEPFTLEAGLTLSLPRSSIDDLVFSVFTSNFFKLSYKISLLKNQFLTLFFIRFS